MEAPNLDRSTYSVRWAIEAAADHGVPIITSVALVFGRDGFEKLSWGGTKSPVSGSLLRIAQASFGFPIGQLAIRTTNRAT